MNQFATISADRRTINIRLPVPLGAKVYRIRAACGNYCRIPDRPAGVFHCATLNSLCFTIPMEPAEEMLTFENIKDVLPRFGELYFATKEEAEAATQNIVKKNRKRVSEYGLLEKELQSDGG